MDYSFIGVGSAPSIVTAIDFSNWGSQVIVSCLYDPQRSSKPYRLIFDGCTSVRYAVLDQDASKDDAADLIGFTIGKEASQKPATITTDIFEASISYDTFRVEK